MLLFRVSHSHRHKMHDDFWRQDFREGAQYLIHLPYNHLVNGLKGDTAFFLKKKNHSKMQNIVI